MRDQTPRSWVNLTGESFPERRLTGADGCNYPGVCCFARMDWTDGTRRVGHNEFGHGELGRTDQLDASGGQ